MIVPAEVGRKHVAVQFGTILRVASIARFSGVPMAIGAGNTRNPLKVSLA